MNVGVEKKNALDDCFGFEPYLLSYTIDWYYLYIFMWNVYEQANTINMLYKQLHQYLNCQYLDFNPICSTFQKNVSLLF